MEGNKKEKGIAVMSPTINGETAINEVEKGKNINIAQSTSIDSPTEVGNYKKYLL